VRGRRIAIVFQDSITSLNPVLTIGRQITESLETHLGLSGAKARARALELLEGVSVPDSERRLRQYPHQLSGGLRQRVAVAIALAPDPEVLIADEPTTALDVTVQAQVLDVLRSAQRERNVALLLISHDLGVMAGLADDVAVMYAGRIVEHGPAEQVFAKSHHPYTGGLLRSVPRIDDEVRERLPSIPGAPPSLLIVDPGCPFRPRCPLAMPKCAVEDPPLEGVESASHRAACWAAVRSKVP
jgi:oligopeptide/dipeptide ABC transporter ATP-binding protein